MATYTVLRFAMDLSATAVPAYAIDSCSLSSTPLRVVFEVMQFAIPIAISDQDFVTDDHSGHGRRVGWAPLDGASAGTLEM
jgi:hypothetical protein